MATRDFTASAVQNKSLNPSTPYPTLSLMPACGNVAEPSGDYEPKAVDNAGFNEALRTIEVRALCRAANGQIGRLLRLADLLDTPVAIDRPAEVLAQYASEIRRAADALEETLHQITDPVLEGDD